MIIAAIGSILLIVVTFRGHDLAMIVCFWASILDKNDWQSHLRLALLLSNVLECSISILIHQVVRLVVIASVVDRSRCETSL